MSVDTRRFFLKTIPWYSWAMAAIFAMSVVLRFWGLGRFNVFVFDEVYYAKFANNYLTRTPFFNAHPPLSQYIIAIGIWLGDQLPIGHDTANTLTGSLRTTFSYRWFNAIFGSLIPPVVGFLAYQLTQRHTYMVIASLLMAMDGLFLVDSRYALNNVFLVLFGLLGQLLLLQSISMPGSKRETSLEIFGDVKARSLKPIGGIGRWVYLGGSGIFFGLSIACKWNGLWFLLGIWLILGLIVVHQLATRRKTTDIQIEEGEQPSVLTKMSRLQGWEISCFLVLLPVLTYAISWLPHLEQNPQPDFWAMQNEIFSYHKRIGNGKEVHPYCANWYTWPLMMRPLAYYYEVVKNPTSPSLETIYDVHAIGNPFLWWLAFGVIVVMTWQLWRALINKGLKWDLNSPLMAMPIFCLANYGANLFPWIRVTRCVYIYHYMGSLVYAILALAWFIDRWLHSPSKQWRSIGVTSIFVIAVGFAWWMPIYLGLPLDRAGLSMRMTFNPTFWKEIGEMWNWI
jgi:dolichyl-phosphate-mannose-protein mannosyltransferase